MKLRIINRSFARYAAVSVLSVSATLLSLFVLSFLVDINIQATSGSVVLVAVSLVLFNALVGLIYSLWKSRRTHRQIVSVSEVCDAISEGNFSHNLKVPSFGEIGVLADKINQLSASVEKKFQDVQVERTQLKMMLASMIEGIVSIDPNWKILFCNTKAMKLLGVDPKDYRQYKLNEVKGFEPLYELVEEALASKKLVEKEYKSYTDAGKKVIEMHGVSFSGQNTSGVIIVLNDISELRKLQKIRRDFVANVSHEIKTPLTAIRGYTETLLDGALEDSENSRRFVSKIDTNTVRLLGFVQDILSMAKLEEESGGVVETIPLDWMPIIDSVLSSHEDLIKANDLQVTIESADQSCMVLGEIQAMTQVLDNLVTNAIRYTPKGGEIKVHVYREKSERQGILVVEDSGVGIPKKSLNRVFERFYLVDKARSSQVGGTGLGLSIVKHLVQAMNGTVSVESELGAGSRFKVVLDLAN